MARKRPPEEHENNERWLVSYADFITLLFAFFVVMYSISQVNEGKYRVLSDAFVIAFQHSETAALDMRPAAQNATLMPLTLPLPHPDVARRQQQEKMADIAHDLLKVIDPLAKQGLAIVTQSNRGVSVEISASSLFKPGVAVLEPQAVEALNAVADVLAGSNNLIQVEGHTDNLPINNALYPSNWELSTARASSVVRLFLDKKIAGNRLVAVGYADKRGVRSNDTAEGRARNRRVALLVLPEGQETALAAPPGAPGGY